MEKFDEALDRKMNKLEKTRWRNVLKKAARANRFLKKGYVIFDHYGHRFTGFKFDQGKLYEGSEKCRVIWMSEDGSWGLALHIPIKEYNALTFDKWQVVDPKSIKKL